MDTKVSFRHFCGPAKKSFKILDILQKFKEEFFADGVPKLQLHQDTTVATANGELVHQKGRLEFEATPGKFAAYQQVFMRDSSGAYLIYHDEFEP